MFSKGTGGIMHLTHWFLRRKEAAKSRRMEALKHKMQAVCQDMLSPAEAAPVLQSRQFLDLKIEASTEPSRKAEFKITLIFEIAPDEYKAWQEIATRLEGELQTLPNVAKAMVVLTAMRVSNAKVSTNAAATKAENPTPNKGVGKGVGTAKIIAVASGKGGVGKSTVAVNLAVALGMLGYRVGLVDADVYGPSVPMITGTSGFLSRGEGGGIQPKSAHGISLMSIGYMIPEDSAVVWRGPMIQKAARQMLEDTLWENPDFLVLDLPPGTGDITLSLAQNFSLAGAVVVSTPQDLALIDAIKALAMFEKLNVPVLGLVENMSTYICPKCGHEEAIFGTGGVAIEAENQGLKLLATIPLTRNIRSRSDAGYPVALDTDTSEGAAFHSLAKQVLESLKV